MSRSFDGGFMTFVLPLIVDGIFHKAMPWLFAPNSIQLLQTEEFSFSQVMWRKRRDRVLQAAAIGGLLAALAAAAGTPRCPRHRDFTGILTISSYKTNLLSPGAPAHQLCFVLRIAISLGFRPFLPIKRIFSPQRPSRGWRGHLSGGRCGGHWRHG
mmetsp:Transcript_4142/g.13093  ORF Transcript_4142/g.13093 Transcript_4142/m.13093 type:complete len:156 (+) Transcript_4142:1696-2163(+)